jgi:hypothetical protein
MHTGCQWYNLPIEKDSSGNYEIHYTRVFKSFKYWLYNAPHNLDQLPKEELVAKLA